MKALITGGMGFIGSHLCELLLAGGHEVALVDNLSTGRAENVAHLAGHKRLQIHIGNVRDKALMESLLEQNEVVFHLAAVVGVRSVLNDPLNCLDTNIRGTDMLMELACRYGNKVLIASSSEVYGKGTEGLLSENSNRILGPTTVTRWVYSVTKAVDECLAMSYAKGHGLPVVVMRFFNTVGPRQSSQYGMVLPTFVQQALKGEPITVYGDGSQIRSFTYVADAVHAAAALSQTEAAYGEVFNIGGTEPVSIAELAQRVKRITGSKSSIEFIPYEVAYGDGFEDSVVRVPDISKLHAAIGYEPQYSLNDMIVNTIEYFLERQPDIAPRRSVAISLNRAPTMEENACQSR